VENLYATTAPGLTFRSRLAVDPAAANGDRLAAGYEILRAEVTAGGSDQALHATRRIHREPKLRMDRSRTADDTVAASGW